jgi:pyrophosphatase PpaX
MRELSRMTRPCDLIVFDLDGTLVDTHALHIASTQAALVAVFGAQAPAEVVARSLGLPLGDSMRVVSAGRGRVPELMAAFLDYYADHEGDGAQCFAEVLPTLTTLRAAQVPLALLSNKLRTWGLAEIERLGLAAYFTQVVFMEDMPTPKPSGLALQPILTTQRVPATRTLLVGDGVGDLRCAEEAGALSGAALWGPQDPAPLLAARPSYAFHALKEILALMQLSS